MIYRLLGIVYILMKKGTVTAGELAARFEVSIRTIYRDVESLNLAGIPVYARKGKNGGICLMETFVLDRMLVSEEEQKQILAALVSLRETGAGKDSETLKRLGEFFRLEPVNWVAIDFSDWSGRRNDLFIQIREAILGRHVMVFDYYGQHGEMRSRTVEPVQLLFKEYTWYVRAFCRTRQAMRLFKVLRMKRVQVLEETFESREEYHDWPETDLCQKQREPDEKVSVDLIATGEKAIRMPQEKEIAEGLTSGQQLQEDSEENSESDLALDGKKAAEGLVKGAAERLAEKAAEGPAEKTAEGLPLEQQFQEVESGNMSLDQGTQGTMTEIILRIDKGEAYRIYDRFEEEEITILPSGDFKIHMKCSVDDWVYGLILSFGPAARVLEPAWVREETAGRIRKMAELYE